MPTTKIPGNTITGRITPGGFLQPVPGGSITVPGPNGKLVTLKACSYACRTIDLSTPFTGQQVSFTGTVLAAIFATSPTAIIYARFDQPTADPVPFTAPFSIRGFPFSNIYFDNPTAQPGVSITILAILDANDLNIQAETP